MKKKYFFIIIPIAILTIFYFKTKKVTVQGSFKRSFISKDIPIINTVVLKNNEIIDGICSYKNILWVNSRNYITKYDATTGKETVYRTKYNNGQKPIVNFYIDDDWIYYYQANTKTVNLINTKDSSQKSFTTTFPFTYFVKLKNNSFIFLESVLGIASMQVHYIDYDHNRETINQTIFSKEIGSGMRYSGSWTYGAGQNVFFFVPFYDDQILCFKENGDLHYQFKPIDYQNQNLKIIKENNLFYLSPDANMIRSSSFSSKSLLFLSSYIRAINQSKSDYKTKSTIDVYDNTNGKYKYSIYIPKLSGQSAVDFSLGDDKILYASYGYKVVKYDFSKILKDEN